MVGIIGTGRVGPSLAKAFKGAGVKVSGIWGRTREKCLDAASFADTKAFFELDNLVDESRVLIIAVRDDVIEDVATRIKVSVKGKIVAHTSGSLPSEILSPLREKGAFVASFHPLQSFGSRESGVELLKESFIALEGDKEALEELEKLALTIGAKPFRIRSDSKTLYHAAAVMTCNLLYGLYYMATTLLSACGVEEGLRDRVLIPLLQGTVKNIERLGPVRALTGPVSRGDVGTIEKHMEEMKKRGLSRHLEVYKLLSSVLVEMAEERGLEKKALEKLKRALS